MKGHKHMCLSIEEAQERLDTVSTTTRIIEVGYFGATKVYEPGKKPDTSYSGYEKGYSRLFSFAMVNGEPTITEINRDAEEAATTDAREPVSA